MSTCPRDIQSTLIWHETRGSNSYSASAIRNPKAHPVGCDVYWGSHGCDRPQGHDGDHWCDCCNCENHPDHDSGCVAGPPYYGPNTEFRGDDA